MSGYRGGRRNMGPRRMAAKYAGACAAGCERGILPGDDISYQRGNTRHVDCRQAELAGGERTWVGSPVSGSWSETRDERTRRLLELELEGGRRDRGGVTTASGRGVVPYRRNGHRCEDAPCCGCCS